MTFYLEKTNLASISCHEVLLEVFVRVGSVVRRWCLCSRSLWLLNWGRDASDAQGYFFII